MRLLDSVKHKNKTKHVKQADDNVAQTDSKDETDASVVKMDEEAVTNSLPGAETKQAVEENVAQSSEQLESDKESKVIAEDSEQTDIVNKHEAAEVSAEPDSAEVEMDATKVTDKPEATEVSGEPKDTEVIDTPEAMLALNEPETTDVMSHTEKFYKKYNISDRETEIIEALVVGKTNKEIAAELYISINTVKTHIKNIYRKLEVKNRVQLLHKIKFTSSDNPLG